MPGTLTLFSYNKVNFGYSCCGTEPPPDESGSAISSHDLPTRSETVLHHPRQNGGLAFTRPSLSPDGTKIAYAEMGEDGYNLDVYVMNADGTNRVNLSNYPSDSADIYNCRYAGPRDLVTNIFRCMDHEPAWSPMGNT